MNLLEYIGSTIETGSKPMAISTPEQPRDRRLQLRATAREEGDEVTVSVEGQAPRLFSLPLLLPSVRASASLPLERYPAAEAAP